MYPPLNSLAAGLHTAMLYPTVPVFTRHMAHIASLYDIARLERPTFSLGRHADAQRVAAPLSKRPPALSHRPPFRVRGLLHGELRDHALFEVRLAIMDIWHKAQGHVGALL